MRRLLPFLVVVALLLPTAPASAQSCTFQLGFAVLHDLIPEIVGDCRSDESHGANGDGLQETTKGLLVWRAADNWTAFTNGDRTWINGPCGLQDRPNEERFPWELGNDCDPPPGAPLQPRPRDPNAPPDPEPIPPPPDDGPPAPTFEEETVVIDGTGTRNTLPFFLEGGHYAVAWSFTLTETDNCAIALDAVDGGVHERLLNDIFDAGTHRGDTILYNLPAGSYYLDVLECGRWRVAFVGGS